MANPNKPGYRTERGFRKSFALDIDGCGLNHKPWMTIVSHMHIKIMASTNRTVFKNL